MSTFYIRKVNYTVAIHLSENHLQVKRGVLSILIRTSLYGKIFWYNIFFYILKRVSYNFVIVIIAKKSSHDFTGIKYDLSQKKFWSTFHFWYFWFFSDIPDATPQPLTDPETRGPELQKCSHNIISHPASSRATIRGSWSPLNEDLVTQNTQNYFPFLERCVDTGYVSY